MAEQPDNVANAAIDLWEKLADEIVSIVGEAGFASLYERSVHLTQPTFPWLPPSPLPPQGNRFAELKARLADQPTAHVLAANTLLLTSFTDILASLIGEQMTSSILRSAWGSLASAMPDKEPDNE